MKQLTTTKMTAVCPICGSKFEFEPEDIHEIDDPEYYNSENDITCPGVDCPACETEVTISELKKSQDFTCESKGYKAPDEEQGETHLFGRRY